MRLKPIKPSVIAASARKPASTQPVVPMELVKTAEPQFERPDAQMTYLDGAQAYAVMRTGKVVRRVDPNNTWAKFHRVNPATQSVETAENADKMVRGDWERARTDVASWFASKFVVVSLETVQVKLKYQ